jgi:hypothetical protein
MAGGGVGMALGAVCGPLAIVCAIPLGIVGAGVGLAAGVVVDIATKGPNTEVAEKEGMTNIGELPASEFSPPVLCQS